MRILALLPALALVTVLLLIPLPVDEVARRWPALLNEVENAAHLVVFAWLAWLTFRALRRRMPAPRLLPYPLAFLIVVTFGLATEVIQAMVGRDSAWIDLGNDALGAAVTLLLIARKEYRSRRFAPAAVGLAIVLAAVAVAPLAITLTAYGWRNLQAPVLWQVDSALFARFTHWQEGQYPGVEINELYGDWRGYRTLDIDVENLIDAPLELHVRVHDRGHNHQFRDRYNGGLTLRPGEKTTWRIPVEQIRNAPAKRRMDMEAIRVVVVFQARQDEPRHFRVAEIRLTR